MVANDLEKAVFTAKIDKKSICRPTISAIDVHVGRPTHRYPRSLRKDESTYIASLPPLEPKCTRIYLREEDCRARDVFAPKGTHILEIANQFLQFLSQSWQRISPDSAWEVIESNLAKILEKSGVDRWRSIHESDRFDIWDLRNLFDHQNQASRGFLVQLNVEASQAHDGAIFAHVEDTGKIKKKLHAGRFKGDTVFWEKYANLEICRLEAEDAFEVHCWFPALSFLQVPENPSDEHVFPLLIQFEQLLCSDDSSVPLSIGDLSMIQSYIVLDYLRCVTLSWLNFLKRINYASSLAPSRVLTQSQHDNDILITATLQNTINDLEACVSYVLDRTTILHDSASPGQSVSNISSQRSSRKHLLMVQDLRAQLEYLSRQSTSFRERSKQLSELGNAATSNNQAQSARRLTIIASIFLPLTLAASLLAMNVPAASIGRLWYDFAGMCICIGFVCLACYLTYGKVQDYRQSDSTIGAWSSWTAATDTGEGVSATFTSFLRLWGVFTVVAASFLAGMFNSFGAALDALKYGIPILVGVLALLWMVHFARDSFPFLHDGFITARYTANIYSEIRDRDTSGTIARTPHPGVSLSPDFSAEQSTATRSILNLEKRLHDIPQKEVLLSTAEAIQNMKDNKLADPEKPMVGFTQQLIQEILRLDKSSRNS